MTRRTLSRVAIMVALGAALNACAQDKGDGRPRPKPGNFAVQLEGPVQGSTLLASVASKDGELMVLQPNGSVQTMRVDSREGRIALDQTRADMRTLADVIEVADSGPAAVAPRGPSAQELALKEFANRTQLLQLPETPQVDPEWFLGARLGKVQNKGGTPDATLRDGDMVQVAARLRPGLDDAVGFAYSTCVLAGWADKNGSPYARHIMTTKGKQKQETLIGSVYVLSDKRPLGLQVMETNQTLRDCKARGIPAA